MTEPAPVLDINALLAAWLVDLDREAGKWLPRPPAGPGALRAGGRPLSLQAMLKLNVLPLLECVRHQAFLTGSVGAAAQNGLPLDTPIWPGVVETLRPSLMALHNEAARAGLALTADAASRIIHRLQAGYTLRQLDAALEDLTSRLNDEIGRVRVLLIEAKDATYYAPDDPLFGKVVDAAFPSARFDIAEAGKCLALDRHTAAVMHTMRALEPGLAALAASYGVAAGANWNTTLNQLESALRDRSAQRSAEEKTWAATVGVHLRFVKDAHRNEAMHGRARYDARGARELVDAAGVFMRDVAFRLSEPGSEDEAARARFVGKMGGSA